MMVVALFLGIGRHILIIYTRKRVSATHFDAQSPFEGIQIDIGSSPTFSNDMIDQDNIVQTHGVRRSSRPFKMPAKFNDFIVGSNVRINTWTICNLSAARKPIGCKWIFKIKYKAYGARLAAKGFSQKGSSAIQIAANPISHERTKHFELEVHLVREKVSPGVDKAQDISNCASKESAQVVVDLKA
ncbi:ribonuclease H-like domain-containing protein [Tanacetum coccineum]